MKYLFVIPVILWACEALSWSRSVHMELGRVVYQQLSKKERRYYAKLSSHMPQSDLEFYQLSPWVDAIRNEPVLTLFDRQVPQALKPFQQRHSSTWHYENRVYSKPRQRFSCSIINKGQLREALLAIDSALQSDITKNQEAMLVAFVMHLLEDLHQPLHTGTLVRPDCSIDLGGNRYCLQYYAGKCTLNLHQLWDQGFGMSKGLAEEKFQANRLAHTFQLESLVDQALNEGETHLAQVYAIDENRHPSEGYIQYSRDVAEEQLKKTVERVSAYLKMHYARTKKKITP